MRKILSAILVVFYILHNVLFIATAVNTDERASPWTREKAAHLAQIALFNADKSTIDSLFAAGSASAAVNLIFPNSTGPDRTAFNANIANYTGSGFNWGDTNHTTRLYQLMYASDPYEGKKKLFSLFEDIFSVNIDSGRDITGKDVFDLHGLIYTNMLGNYQTLVKRVLNNNGGVGDYAAGKFLDLYNQNDPKNPNENFARELLQLFLMGEYEPYRSKDNGDIRNYEESDVKSLARILTGLNADAMTHVVSLNIANHYSGSTLLFLSGGLTGSTPPYYDSASGTIDPVAILSPVNGNNGLEDNVIEYIFAKKSDQIALFLADRIARFYISDKPTRTELDTIAQIIKNNNFDILPSIKSVLALDMIYSNVSMNSVRYKNPLELTMGIIRHLHANDFAGIISDPNIYDGNLLRRLGWTPLFPGSIFGRDGFDDSLKWSSTSTESAWMTASNYFTYRISGTGAVDFLSLLGAQKKEITTGNISVMTHVDNSYSGVLNIVSGTLDLGNAIASVADISVQEIVEPSIEEQILANGYPLDPVEAILGGENLEFFKSEVYQWIRNESVFEKQPIINTAVIPDTTVKIDIIPVTTSTGTEEQKETKVVDSGSLIGTGENISTTEQISIPSDTGAQVATGVVSLSSAPIVSVTEEVISSTGSETVDISSDTGVVISLSGETTESPVIITGSLDSVTNKENSGTTNSGIVTPLSVTPTKTPDTIVSANAVSIITGSVMLPTFQISTNLGMISVASGTYNADTRTLQIHSGVVTQNGSGTQILSGSIMFDMNSKLIADTIKPNEIIDIYEDYFYGEKRLQSDTRNILLDFLTMNASGALIPVAPTNTNYFNKNIRGLLSILISQPEYVLLSGYDLPVSTENTDQHFLDNIPGKLFFVELYGGNDYMTSIIPKDEYNTYLDYRSNQSGSIAITGTGLVDIGNFYMNSALAYGSGGGAGFKSLFDQGYLKIFNRVGGYKHSNDHDAAAKQITSYDSTTSISAEGAFGHMVKSEFESSHTISLGSKSPNIYRAGHYVNLGGNVILSNPLDQGGQWRSHMDTMQKITLTRSYPSNTRNLFKDAGRISEIGKLSVSQGGAPGASGDMNSVFRFAKVLMTNNIGRSFYMGGYGGYDTHGDQFTGLNRNLNFVSTAVTNFFNDVKDTQDVTIVIFSEFGRTNKTNGDLGTDHGDAGGMFVITSNQALRTQLQAGTYGNMSIKNSKSNSLTVGVDYRSVFGSIFNGLYNLDPSTYFATPISLQSDVSLTPNKMSLLNYSYQASGQNPLLNIEFNVSGANYNPGKAGYTRLMTGTGFTNQKSLRINEKSIADGYRYTAQLNSSSSSQNYFTIESFSNQFVVTGLTGSLVGATKPLVLGNTVREISQAKTSILPLFGNTMAPSVLAGSGLILENTGGNVLNFPNNTQTRLFFSSGLTNVTDLTYLSGSTTWKGGFILGDQIDKNLFIPDTAMLISDNITLPKQNITHLFKIGADVLGVGMKLNKSVGIEFTGLIVGERYRAISSQDGISWNDVESAGRVYTASSTGSVLVNTDHFSYFALLSANIIVTPPSCTISINPASVVNGSGTTLTWSIIGAFTGTLNPGNTILGSSGSIQIIPPSNAVTPYTLTVTNSAGTSSCVANVTAAPVVVVPPPPVTPPTCTIAINPASVVNGNAVAITWSMTGALSGTLNPGNTILGSSGTLAFIPPSNVTTTYTIAVTNSGGTNSCSASVTSAPVVVPPVTPPVTPPSGGNGGGTITGPGGGGGGSSVVIRMIDTCLNGDKSGNFYDGLCTLRSSVEVISSDNNTTIVNTPVIENILNTLVSDIESKKSNYIDADSDQKIYKTAIQLWKEITKNTALKEDTTLTILEGLQDIKENSQNRATRIAAARVMGLLAQFMKTGGLGRIDVNQPVSQQNDSVTDDSQYNIGGYRYVAAERAVTMRKNAFIGFKNAIGYLDRNTKISVISESNGWTKVLYNGVEGYIKSIYLRNANVMDIFRETGIVSGNTPKGTINVIHSAFVRTTPDFKSRITAVVYRDQVVSMIDTLTGWYEVILSNGSRGYIRRELVNTMDTTL